MRSSLPSLIRIQPIPATTVTSARLPPSLRPRSPSAVQREEAPKGTLAQHLIAQSQEQADSKWPGNLRVESFEKGKDKFWKVSI